MDPVHEEDLPRLLASDLHVYFPVFYAFYRQWVFHIAWRLVGNPDDAEDIVQETFQSVSKALQRKSAEDIEKIRFRSYLRRATTHTFINIHRKKRITTTSLETPENTAMLEALADVLFEQPEIALENKELNQRVYVLLKGIPLEYRVVVVLKHIRRLTVPEIACVLKTSNDEVRARLSYGMRLLRLVATKRGYQHSRCIG